MQKGTSDMKRTLLLLALVAVGGSSGCSIIDRLFLANVDGPYANHNQAGGHCEQCGGHGHCEDGACVEGSCPPGGTCDHCETGPAPLKGRYGGLAKHGMTAAEAAALEAAGDGQIGPAGPPSGAVAYPYYTTRGPRDFLARRPPSIGPE
jgi:hypothetical protein